MTHLPSEVTEISEKWCGGERTKYAVLKVEATSFVLAILCLTIALVYDWSFIGL